MGKCANPDCQKSISILSFKGRCEKCDQVFCKNCFRRDHKWIDKIKHKGQCWGCYLESDPNSAKAYPQYLFTSIPRTRDVEFARTQVVPISKNPFDYFGKISEIGKGNTSRVFKVRELESGKIYALKEINIAKSDLESIMDEFSRSVLSPCQNIVTCYALYKYRATFAILLELMDLTLHRFLRHWNSKRENTIAFIIREMTKGLLYLHQSFNIHRDLKSENVFLNQNGEVKLGDFGLSVQLTRERPLRDTFAGSPLWIAPEILAGQYYGISCDVWSLGVIAYELAVGHPMFHTAKSVAELHEKILNEKMPQIHQEWSEEYREFIRACLQIEPEDRKTCADLLEMEFLTQVDEEEAKENIVERVVELLQHS
jgi:serine/threonine protein kinase